MQEYDTVLNHRSVQKIILSLCQFLIFFFILYFLNFTFILQKHQCGAHDPVCFAVLTTMIHKRL